MIRMHSVNDCKLARLGEDSDAHDQGPSVTEGCLVFTLPIA